MNFRINNSSMPCYDAESTCAPLWHFSRKHFLTVCNHISCLAVKSLSARLSPSRLPIGWCFIDVIAMKCRRRQKWELVSTFETWCCEIFTLISVVCLLLLHCQLHFLQAVNSQSAREVDEAFYLPTLCIAGMIYHLCKSTEPVCTSIWSGVSPSSFARGRFLASKSSHGVITSLQT